MDLAEIRKKSQRGKKNAPSPVPVKGESDALPEAVPEVPEPLPAVVVRERSAPRAARKAPAAPFDPVSAILAGRASVVQDEELSPLTEAQEGESLQEFLCFRVSSEEYAVNIMQIKEIIKPREVTDVPRTPEFVAGILSLRGAIIPVIDINRRLGFTKQLCSGKERIIVVHRGEAVFGVLVDEVSQVVRLRENEFEPPPMVLDGIDREFVSGLGRHQGRMLILLNMEKVLDINVQ